MRNLFGITAAAAMVAGSAGAQGVSIDLATRTLSTNQTVAYPSSTTIHGQISGTLDGSGIPWNYGTNVIRYQVIFAPGPSVGLAGPNASTSIGGILNVDLNGGGPVIGLGYGNVVRYEDRWDYGDDPYNQFGPNGEATFYLPHGIFTYVLSMSGGVSPGPGQSGSLLGSARLAGANVLDQNGNVIASALFDDRGNGVFTTVPEPSSVALLATGLFGVAPFLKRSRSA